MYVRACMLVEGAEMHQGRMQEGYEAYLTPMVVIALPQLRFDSLDSMARLGSEW